MERREASVMDGRAGVAERVGEDTGWRPRALYMYMLALRLEGRRPIGRGHLGQRQNRQGVELEEKKGIGGSERRDETRRTGGTCMSSSRPISSARRASGAASLSEREGERQREHGMAVWCGQPASTEGLARRAGAGGFEHGWCHMRQAREAFPG